MSKFLNRRKVTLAAAALTVTLGTAVGVSGQAQAAGLPNFPHTVACYQNFGSKNDNRILITNPVRVGDYVRYTAIPEFWFLGRYQHLKNNPTSSLSVAYRTTHFASVFLCNAYSNKTSQYWPYAQTIKWGG